MKLEPGDSVYYEPNLAMGFLISSSSDGIETTWTYALRSPPRDDLANFLVSIQTKEEKVFIDAIKAGRLILYKGKK